MSPSSLQLHQENSIARIEFKGPDDLPRLELSLLDELEATLATFTADTACTSIVLHGSEKCFAVGANLAHVVELNGVEALDFARRGQRLYQTIYRSPKPVVAAISGFCMGGAWDLAMSCQARLCTPDATFRHPGPTIGIFSGWGGTQRLPRALGSAKAYELLLEGRKVGAAEALRIGLVDAVVDWESLLHTAADYARKLSAPRSQPNSLPQRV